WHRRRRGAPPGRARRRRPDRDPARRHAAGLRPAAGGAASHARAVRAGPGPSPARRRRGKQGGCPMNASSPARGSEERSIRRNMALGLAISFLLFGTIGGWASVAQLAGAVIAPGLLVVESNVKRVQHPTGGVIGELNVREGDVVRAGDVLARLDATIATASLQLVSKQLDQAAGRVARLAAERDGLSEISFPPELVARAVAERDAAAVIDGEKRLFAARRVAMEGQKAQLRERIEQALREIEGLDAQQAAKA